MIITTNSLTCLKVSIFLILLTIHVKAYSSFVNNRSVNCRKRERLALLKFKAELTNDYGQLSTWRNEGGDGKDCCKWKGVLCDNRTNHVVELDLHGMELEGKISPSLLELTNLNYLDLSSNHFPQAQVPEFIGSLRKLQHLNLSLSYFDGLIPHSLGNLSNLRFLDLSLNSLKGGIPRSIGSLISLSHLDLSGNYLQGEFPDSMGNLTRLSHLGLSDNQLQVELLDSTGNLTSLSHLDLSQNQLQGELPYSLGNLTRLSHLDLSHNQLRGELSYSLGNLTRLSYLDLSQNQLQGKLPYSLGNLTRLSHLDLSHNQLQGELPYSLGNLTRLSHLDLSQNQLQGELPETLGNLSRLSYLVLSNNRLHGGFPRSYNQLNESLVQGNLKLPNLEVLDVSENEFTGQVPNLSSCLSLRRLSLYSNMFNGILTISIGYLSNVEHLDLSSNYLEGQISEAHLLNLSKLQVLDLSFNSNLTIKISSFWNPPFQLSNLVLTQCKLGPHFPKWLQNQKQLEIVDISDAKISDTIPQWFWDNIQMTEELNMSHNQIHGALPNLSSNIHLLMMDLSSNEFNGSLPLPPQYAMEVDLSRNKFSGTITNFCHFNFRNSPSNFYASHALDLSNNLFSTEISQDCFTHLMHVTSLNLANNNFFGEIPNSIDSCSLFSLSLRNNSFMGKFPRSLKNCSCLIMLDLGENKFTGTIPSWLGESMPNLGILSLKSNKLYGVLPSSLCHLTNLQVLDISRNKISGTIPECVKNFTMMCSKANLESRIHDYLTMVSTRESVDESAQVMWKRMMVDYVNALELLTLIDLSDNSLTGEIPVEITSLVGLFALNLSTNNLVGTIPHDIGRLELLNVLDLSKNNLSGGIPPTLSQLSHLGVLDLSFNNLSGRIPWDTHMQTFDASTYMGNPGLCGPPLVLPTCPQHEMPKKSKSSKNVDEVHEKKFITRGFYISMALGFIVAFWGVSGTLFLNKWCWIIVLKMFIRVEDWLYVNILVNKNRIQRHFEKH